MLTKLMDLGYVGTGTTPSMKNPDYYNSDDILFIKPSDINDNEVTEITRCEFFISNCAKQKARIFPKNTILCVCIGSIGKIGITTKESSCNQQINYIIPNEKHNAKFLAYSLLFRKDELIRIGSDGPVVPIINKTRFENIEIVTFDYNKEMKVVNELDNINNFIAFKQKEINDLDELIKSRFIEMFMDKGYPIIPLKELSISKAEYGAGSASVPFEEGRPRYVRITDINDDGTLNDDVVCSINPQDDVDYKLSYGDFMFARMGATVGKTYAYFDGNEIYAGYLIRYKLDLNKLNPRYLFTYSKLNEYLLWVKNNQSGAAQPGINAKKYDMLSIPVAPIALQNEFASFVKLIDKSKFVCHSKYFL